MGGSTLVHQCVCLNKNKVLARVLLQLDPYFKVVKLAHFNDLPGLIFERGVRRSYEDYKTGFYLILCLAARVGGLAQVNSFLSAKHSTTKQTALGGGLRDTVCFNVDACKGLLDASKQIFDDFSKQENSSPLSPATSWLTRMTSDHVAETETTHLHLALKLLASGRIAAHEIIDRILTFPGANELNLTSLSDDINGDTPLHIAVTHQNADILFKLLQYTSASLQCALDKLHDDEHLEPLLPVNVQNKRGESALHLASRLGFGEGCKMLLEYGASIELRDAAGRYALTDALSCGDNGTTAAALLQACCMNYNLEKLDHTVARAVVRSHGILTSSCRVNAKFEFEFTPLHVAVAIGSEYMTKKMLESGALLTATSEDGKTPLHLAVEAQNGLCFILLSAAGKERAETQVTNNQEKMDWINMTDYFGQTALHLAILHFCPAEVVQKLCSEGAFVDLMDTDGDTPLHLAARGGHEGIISVLLSTECKYSCNDREKWITMCNCAGETALHDAAKKGHTVIASTLIQKSGSRRDELLLARDGKHRTFLQIWEFKEDSEVLDMIPELLKSCSDDVKYFLLWDTLGVATPGTKRHSLFQELAQGYSKQLKFSTLEYAVKIRQDLGMTRELINRGADITPLDDESRLWISRFLRKNVSDQPALQDTLGRTELVLAVAALLLNSYTGTPISIGVFGDWGMGKSSFMLQVEGALLCMAVKKSFGHTSASQSQYSNGNKFNMLEFSWSAVMLRRKVNKALYERMSKDDISRHEITEENAIETFPIKVHSQYASSLLKELALVDRSKLVDSVAATHERKCLLMLLFSCVYQAIIALAKSKLFCSCGQGSISKSNHTSNEQDEDLLVGHSPTIMTVHYNAWHYDGKTEAAAGLAVNISRALEDAMTPCQWLRMCLIYSWQSQRINIFVKLLLPLIVFFFVAFLVVLLWRVAPIRTEYKLLTLPMGILGVIWVFFKTFLQFMQPVAETIASYIQSPDHSAMLGYQQHVINDINFLINQLCTESNLIWRVLGYSLGQIFISNHYYIKGTPIRKQHPTRRSDLRIIVFIDDLDRCEETTVLEVLCVINLILATCGINVLIGVDQHMVERAITRKLLKDSSEKVLESVNEVKLTTTGATHGEAGSHTHPLAKRYLQKIIQLPVEMPEPSREDLMRFLKRQICRVYSDEEKAKHKKNTSDTDEDEETNQPLIVQSQGSSSSQNTSITNLPLQEQLGPSTTLGSEDHAKELVTNEDCVKETMKGKKGNVDSLMSCATTKDVSSSTNIPTGYQGSRKDKHIEGSSNSPCQDQVMNVCVEKDLKGWASFGAQENSNQRTCIDTKELQKKGAPVQKEFRLLLKNFSPMEEDLILKLSEVAQGDGKIPREWKRFLNYHRLCWSILSQDDNMEKVEFNGWQIKLILWIFLCWNWTEKINKIIEVWEDYSSKENIHVPIWRSLLLGDIISFYINKRYPNDKNGKSREPKEEIIKEKSSWIDLLNTLKEQKDLSMKFLHVFQKFRFYCDRKVLTIDQKYIGSSQGDHKQRANLKSILRSSRPKASVHK